MRNLAASARAWVSRVSEPLRRRRLDAQLDEEVEFHLEMLEEEHRRRGLSEADARAAARRSFGGVIQMKEAYREQRGLPFVETLIQDTRYGVRTLLRTPGFTLAAVLTLALGIGANSAIFSVVNAVLLRPLPYDQPDRIVDMYRNSGGLWNRHTAKRFEFFKEHMTAFEAFAAWRPTAFNMVVGDQAEHVAALAVSHDYFRVLGGAPMQGRLFEVNEDQPNGPDAVILTHDLWARLFGSNPAAIGSALSLGDKSYTVVGVMPAGFDPVREADVYVPLKPSPRGPGGGFNYHITARLKDGITREQAEAEAEPVFAGYKASQPASDFGREQAPKFLSFQESLSRDVKPALLMMLGAVGMLLLIACANTASLLLARATGRSREISVRAALGAPRARIIRQLVTESTLLFMIGGLVGVALAYWFVPTLLSLTPAGYLPAQQVTVDAQVLLAMLALSLVTGIVFGLAPAVTLSRRDLVEAFKEDGTRTTSTRRSHWLRRGLVVGEVALCMLLLVGAGLLVQTFVKLRAVDLGFDPQNVLTARMSLMGQRYSKSASVTALYERGLDRLRQIPGVQAAAAVNGVPIEQGLNLNFDRLDTTEVEAHLTDWRYTTPDYFRTMGIQIVQGRPLTERDTAGAPRVAVVSEQFARQHYKDKSPIGQQIAMFKDGPIEIVGIAKDLREAGLSGPIPAVMYVPVSQASDAAVAAAHGYFQVSWVVRASGLTPELTRRVRDELRAIDPTLPITAFRSMEDVRARAMANETFQMTLLATFAAIGLLLAAAGIYGLIAYSVAQRTREFGIRMALGATRHRILAGVLRQGATLTLAGVAAGTVAAIGMTRTMESFLFGVSRLDVTTFVAVGVVLLGAALLASLLPALRAVRLNPVSALRE